MNADERERRISACRSKSSNRTLGRRTTQSRSQPTKKLRRCPTLMLQAVAIVPPSWPAQSVFVLPPDCQRSHPCFGGSRSGVSSMESRAIPPETSNFYCLPGRAGGTPIVLVWAARPGGAQRKRDDQGRDDLPALFSPHILNGLMRTRRPFR
jgi:hypothetical protein